jgi:hypothetical protein
MTDAHYGAAVFWLFLGILTAVFAQDLWVFWLFYTMMSAVHIARAVYYLEHPDED